MMMRIPMAATLVVLATLLAGGAATWQGHDGNSAWTPREREQLRALGLDRLGPMPADPSNRVADDPQAASLGARLFEDARLSGNGTVSCATCHVATAQFQDDRPLAVGVDTASRRTMPSIATGHATWQFWDGRTDSPWAQALGPLESAVEHGGDRVALVRAVAAHYRIEYEALFGALPSLDGLPERAGPVADPVRAAAWAALDSVRQDEVTRAFANIGKAIAAFERTIQFGASRFDRHLAALEAGGPIPADAQLTDDELAGARLFVGKAQCVTCHNGPLFTDQHFHNTGVPAVAGLPADRGRAEGIVQVQADPFNCLGRYSDATPEQCGELAFLATDDTMMVRAYKTPSLRNVAERAPYMHAGQFRTLEEVVAHYDRAPAAPMGTSELKRLRLSARERAQLVAFLRTLSGPVVVVGRGE
ncbi:MAG TPA: cytochrome c peroxidase [Gemmatimonadales bacterium]|nr:cytochrome c peroxidase [Gemmatimonadales bacterium]